MASHTPTPWIAEGRLIYALTPSKETTGSVNRFMAGMSFCNGDDGATLEELEANAARAVVCVNACEGLDDPSKQLNEAREILRGLENHCIRHGRQVMMPQIQQVLRLLGA